MGLTAIEKFASLLPCRGDFSRVIKDESWKGYYPTLASYNGKWYVEWCTHDSDDDEYDDGVLESFKDEDIEAVIEKAYEWAKKHNIIKR